MCAGRGVRKGGNRPLRGISLPVTRARSLPATTARTSLLLNFRFGLVGSGLLVLQSLFGILVRRGRGNISVHCGGVRSLGQPARPLLLGQFSHSVFELLTELVVHLLQIVG